MMVISAKEQDWSRSILADCSVDVRGRTIVVVEDDDDLRGVCSEFLRSRGLLVSACATLLDAFVTIEHRVPDIVLLDHELPDGSGFDLARWLRRRRDYDQVRVIAFSGRKAPADVDEALGAGCDAFVAKPSAPNELLAMIRSLLATPSASGIGSAGSSRILHATS
jgi:DNA-binding response OmpR family regulator